MVIEGVIRPPPEIRAVADRTAEYVAKNGRGFETRILASAKAKTPKFAFLQPTSPFHAYYEDRIQFYMQGGEKNEDEETKTTKQDDKKEGDDTAVREATVKSEVIRTTKSSVVDPLARALLDHRSSIAKMRSTTEQEAEGSSQPNESIPFKTLPPPPSLALIHTVAPASLSLSQVETIQLVAQLTALDGKNGPFFSRLCHREWANPEFAFCQARHGHFAYFSALVDAYRRIYETWTDVKATDEINKMANNVDRCVQLSAYRVEYQRDLNQQAEKSEENGETAGSVNVDWHDFVVVETIDFAVDEIVELSMLPPPPQPQIAPTSVGENLSKKAIAVDVMDEDDNEETIRVVPSYTPRVVSSTTSNDNNVIDPITGKSVPIKDMPEHMRIQLLDPKWAEERKKFQEKQRESNLVSGDVIASNISRFTQARGDMFTTKEQNLLNNERSAKKRLEEANRIIMNQSQQLPGPRVAQPPGEQNNTDSNTRMALTDTSSFEPTAKRPRLDPIQPTMAATPSFTTTPTLAQPPSASGGREGMPTAGFEAISTTESRIASTKDAIPSEQTNLLSEAAFVDSLSKPDITLQIRIPNDPAQMAWNFFGQILSLTVDVRSKVKTVKQELSRQHLNDMPANKIQLKSATAGFLKDSKTLAELNVGPTTTLEMIPKTRGGRK